jgi:hypothetical protein
MLLPSCPLSNEAGAADVQVPAGEFSTDVEVADDLIIGLALHRCTFRGAGWHKEFTSEPQIHLADLDSKASEVSLAPISGHLFTFPWRRAARSSAARPPL